jgi:hypothetical protein
MGKLATFLRKRATDLMEQPPYDAWAFEITVNDDLPDRPFDYVCEDEGLSFSSDSTGHIRSIFLQAADLWSPELDLPAQSERQDVLACMGVPSVSGKASRHPILGDHGPWDRFDYETHSLHIEYEPDSPRILMVTLMAPEAVPQAAHKRMH